MLPLFLGGYAEPLGNSRAVEALGEGAEHLRLAAGQVGVGPRLRMVICSEATDTVRSEVPVWVELYPGHGSRSLVSIEGRYEEYEDIQLPDLLAILDRAVGPTG